MARGTANRFAHFARGLNTADGPYGLREGYEDDPSGLGSESRGLLNVVSAHRGNISKRPGSTELFESPAPTTELFKDISTIGNGSGSFAVCSSSTGKMYAISSALVRTQIVASGLSTTAPWTFLRLPTIGAQGPAFGMNGTDTPRETDGTLANTGNWTAVSGTLKNGTVLEYHENTLWIAGVAAEPYSLFWSSIGDPTAWPVANITKFNPDGGLPITAARSVGPYLLVFKERGIWSVYDSVTSANRKFSDSAGTLSPQSVVTTPDGCFFLDSERGVMVTDGNDVKRVSEQIQPTIDGIAAADLPLASAAYHNGHYYLAAKINGVQQILDYDIELGSWWIHSPLMQALAVWDRGTDLDLVGVGSAAGEGWHLFKPGELRDNGVIFPSYWSGPFHSYRSPHLRKRMRRVHIDGRGRFDIYAAVDYSEAIGGFEGAGNFSTGGTFGGTGTFGTGVGIFGGGGPEEGEVYSLGMGRSWSLTFYSGLEDFWEVDAYTTLVDQRRA